MSFFDAFAIDLVRRAAKRVPLGDLLGSVPELKRRVEKMGIDPSPIDAALSQNKAKNLADFLEEGGFQTLGPMVALIVQRLGAAIEDVSGQPSPPSSPTEGAPADKPPAGALPHEQRQLTPDSLPKRKLPPIPKGNYYDHEHRQSRRHL